MKDTRPVFLDLTKIKFPLMAIVSILHRFSGFILFLMIPLMLWAVDCSLDSERGFLMIQGLIIDSAIGKIITWLVLAALAYHVLAGIRHLLMDWGWFESLEGGRISSIIVFISVGVVAILLGVWLW
jgi:succinate dehydrogenase / fumarate reductase cytochrome b subunit